MTGLGSRVAIACETCRKRKRKCDGATPVCSWCHINKKECLYITERPKKRKWDGDHVANLEGQMALLKDYVRGLETLNPTATRPLFVSDILGDDVDPDDESNPKTDDPSTINRERTTITFPDLGTNVSAVDDVSSMMWRMTIGDDGETSFTGPSGNFCFPSASTQLKVETSQNQSRHQSSTSFILLDISEQLRTPLFNLFLFHINPIQQFLDIETLKMLQEPTVSEPLQLVYAAALSAGALYSDDAEAKLTGEKLAQKLETVALRQCRTSPNVSTVQVLMLLCWRELSLENENMGWMYNSMAASLSLHLGLHVSMLENLEETISTGQGSNSNSSDRLSCVKTFWAYLFIDRLATVLLGRNCMIPWTRVRASAFITSAGPDASLDEIVFDSHCRLWFIHDQFMDKIYSFGFNKLDQSTRYKFLMEAREGLGSFHQCLPHKAQLKRAGNPEIVLVLHMSYYMSRLLVHRPYLQESRDSQTFIMSMRAMSTAANSMVRLVREYEKAASLENCPPFMVHHILTAAVALLLGTTSNEPTLRSQSTSRFRTCFKALLAMQKRWPRARKAIQLLRQLASRWRVEAALPIQYGFVPQVESNSAEVDFVRGMANHSVESEISLNDEDDQSQLVLDAPIENPNDWETFDFNLDEQELNAFTSIFNLDHQW